MIELLIQNGSTIYQPVIEGGLTWTTERRGSPGKLNFNVFKDSIINFQEGNSVRLVANNTKVFYGFIFTKKRDKGNLINVTAYDQLRYLKNKDTYVYGNKTASEVVKMIAKDFNLQTGTIEDTGFKIPSRIEDNKALFDIIQNALDLTLQNKKAMYVLYDNFGKLDLRNIESMKLNLLIDDETGENFKYASSIDGETYNKIKLSYDNEETGKREIYITKDSTNINNWGVLQYFKTIDENVNGKAKADALLELYNKKSRNLIIKDAIGDWRVRGGSMVAVSLVIGDLVINNFMLVEKAVHKIKDEHHSMTLTLRGGDFVA